MAALGQLPRILIGDNQHLLTMRTNQVHKLASPANHHARFTTPDHFNGQTPGRKGEI
jgi:hypothetical protein